MELETPRADFGDADKAKKEQSSVRCSGKGRHANLPRVVMSYSSLNLSSVDTHYRTTTIKTMLGRVCAMTLVQCTYTGIKEGLTVKSLFLPQIPDSPELRSEPERLMTDESSLRILFLDSSKYPWIYSSHSLSRF